MTSTPRSRPPRPVATLPAPVRRAGPPAWPLAIALLLPVAGTVLAQPAALVQAQPQNVLHLDAQASAELTQDTLAIVLAVTREGADAAQVQGQLRQVLDAALAEARRQARPGELEVRTGSFSLYPRSSTGGKPGAPVITGWIGRGELVLEGRNIAAVSALAGRLTGMTVQQVGFSLSREAREKAEAELSGKAIERFKARAEQHARAFGFASYSLREVTVAGGDSGPTPMPRMALRAMATPMADESQPVEAGKTTVTVTVSGSVQLSPR